MTSPADRFTRLEKVAVFLIALGEERAREVLADLDLDTVEQLNDAIRGLGKVSAQEKASVMLEFAHFFYDDKPILGKPAKQKRRPGDEGAGAATGDPAKGASGKKRKRPSKPGPRGGPVFHLPPPPSQSGTPAEAPADAERPANQPAAQKPSDEEQAILHTLARLRQRLDPGKIDWGRAGYDFGEGFKGADESERS